MRVELTLASHVIREGNESEVALPVPMKASGEKKVDSRFQVACVIKSRLMDQKKNTIIY
jgi:hypothetical protein